MTFVFGSDPPETEVTNGAGIAEATFSSPAPGSYTVGASFAGNANYLSSSSSNITQVVNNYPTTTTLTSSTNPSLTDQGVNYVATVNTTGTPVPNGGTVTFTDGGSPIASCEGLSTSQGTATCSTTPMVPGSHAIAASYSGETGYASSTGTLTQVVNSQTSLLLNSSTSPWLTGQAVTFSATLLSLPSGTPVSGEVVAFTFESNTSETTETGVTNGTGVAQATFEPQAPGSYTVGASFAGDPNYLASQSSTITQVVNTQTNLVLNSLTNPSAAGQPVTFSAILTAEPSNTPVSGEGVTFVYGSDPPETEVTNGAGIAEATFSSPAPGSYTVGASFAGNANYLPSSSSNITQVVAPLIDFTTPSSADFTLGSSASFTPIASGVPTPAVTESGALPNGVTFSGGVLSGTPLQTGSFPITFTASNGVVPNVTQSFTLTVLGFHITTTSLPSAIRGAAYSFQLAAAGGDSPYKWKKLSALPKGLKMNSGGLISGTPKLKDLVGPYTVTVSVHDSTKKAHQTVTQSFELNLS